MLAPVVLRRAAAARGRACAAVGAALATRPAVGLGSGDNDVSFSPAAFAGVDTSRMPAFAPRDTRGFHAHASASAAQAAPVDVLSLIHI